ncbi:MAG TPA: SDR family oxidoreductase [Bacteroidia bacterium]|nr:SDR family oxidoreductase [Bacteroidia bacterium]
MSDINNVVFHTDEIWNKAFLVTGGAGFIGSNIVGYLLHHKAAKVRVLDNLSNGFKRNLEPFMNNPAFEFMEGDITDLQTCVKACEGIHMVTNQAALGSVPRSISFPLHTHAANATGFLNMLVAARDAGVERFVYASSSSVYGDLADSPKVESRIGKALSPYAVSKYTNELYAGVFALNYGMKVIGLRYFNVFGPQQDPNGPYAAAIPLFMDALLNDKNAYLNGDGEQTRDFTFVQNAVQANIRAFFTPNPDAFNKVYNVAVGDNISVKKLFSILADIAGKEVKPLHRPDRPGDIKNSLADITLARTYLGYEPLVKLKEGLEITFNWFKNTYK